MENDREREGQYFYWFNRKVNSNFFNNCLKNNDFLITFFTNKACI